MQPWSMDYIYTCTWYSCRTFGADERCSRRLKKSEYGQVGTGTDDWSICFAVRVYSTVPP